MRLKRFESSGVQPLGEGDERRTFADPQNEKRVISETKEGGEKETLLQLKGRYYLTKIVHTLLPEHIPDIYQAGESVDGKQTIDRERIAHSPGHARLQEIRRQGGSEEESAREMAVEMGAEMTALDLELERVGLGFNIDENVGNYTKDEAGKVYYLESFLPWRIDEKDIEVLFDEAALRQAIGALPDQVARTAAEQHLDRLSALLEEEKQALQPSLESKPDARPHIESLNTLLTPFLEEEALATLNGLTTAEEALKSQERQSAKKILEVFLSQLQAMSRETNITKNEYEALFEKYKILSRAVGTLNSGKVDRTLG